MNDVSQINQQRIWDSFSKAVGAEPREHRIIRGVSGLDHPVQAIAVDDSNKRVIIVSAEPNPRIAALMQVDIQATMPDVHVLVARPVVVDLGDISRKLFKLIGSTRLDMSQLKRASERIEKLKGPHAQRFLEKQFGSTLGPISTAFTNVTIPTLTQIVDVLQQASYLDWGEILQSLKTDAANPAISFAKLLEVDNLAIDRQHGICPLPLYEFSEADWELFLSGNRIEDLQQRLRDLDIYQYFFPAPDQLALAMVDRGVTGEHAVLQAVKQAPAMGHPLGDVELLPSLSSIPEILEGLKDLGYVAEGEHGVEVSSSGQTARMSIKFRPREGFVSKVLNRISVNFSASPKDFMGGS